MKPLKILLILSLITLSFYGNSQEKVFSLKFNTLMTFSKPEQELAKAYKGNHNLQPFAEVEVSKFLFAYWPKNRLGIRLGGTYDYNYGNFLDLSYERIMRAKIGAFGLRIYPIASDYPAIEALGKLDFLPNNILGIYLYSLVSVLTINSLHFDYRWGTGELTEYTYLDDEQIGEPIKRDMSYLGWGFQPQLFASEDFRWIVNAQFDFGKYKWTNSAGGISAIKYNYIGFGLQYSL